MFCLVSGLGFSHADESAKMKWGFSPCGKFPRSPMSSVRRISLHRCFALYQGLASAMPQNLQE
jgi:hypothetical protein